MLTPYINFYTIAILIFLFVFIQKLGTNNSSRIRKNDNTLFKILFTIILLFVGTRDVKVGTDTLLYIDFFNHKDFYYQGRPTDILFEYLGRLMHVINSSTEFFIFISATISLWGVYFITNKTSKNKTFSTILFLTSGTAFVTFFLYLGMIRQAISVSYFLCAIYFIFEGKKKDKLYKGIPLYLAAILTHGSCLFTIPFVILTYFKPIIKKEVWYIAIGVTYIMSALNISIVHETLSLIFTFLDDNKYSSYADINFGQVDARSWFNMLLLPYIIISCLMLWLAKKEEIEKWYVQLFFYSTALNNLFFDNLMWSRLIWYCSILIIIAVPNILEAQKKWIKLATTCIILLYFVYKDFRELADNSTIELGSIIVPYDSWFF